MAIVLETTLGDITIDLYTKERPRACLNFLKLCKLKYYNYNLFHTISRDFIAQTGDPTGSRKGGGSVFGILEGSSKKYFEAETQPRIKHTITGLVSFVGIENNMVGSQFFITLAPDLTYLDERHCVFGEVSEGLDVLEMLNEAICDNDNRPYQDVRITHTVILDDPYPDLPGLQIPSRSPSPSAERLQGGRIAPDEEIDETQGKDMNEIEELKAESEAKARATILEMVGDIPDAEMAPPENVLFVCKLNPVTTDDDLEIIFSRFGKINSCEVIRDKKSGDSLQYAFIEFDDKKSCEDAYFKMDNVLIDDRRIHVDFSQSVAKVKWLGKGRGVAHFDDRGKRTEDKKNDLGKGNYKSFKHKEIQIDEKEKYRDRSHKERGSLRSKDDRKLTSDRDYSRRHESRRDQYFEEQRNSSNYKHSRKYENSDKYYAKHRQNRDRDRYRSYDDDRKQNKSNKHEDRYLSKKRSGSTDSESNDKYSKLKKNKKEKRRSSSSSSVDRKKSNFRKNKGKRHTSSSGTESSDKEYRKTKHKKCSKYKEIEEI